MLKKHNSATSSSNESVALSSTSSKLNNFSSSSRFVILPSDIIIHIIDFIERSDTTLLKTSSNNATSILNFTKLCKQWFGRFESDQAIKIIFRYERIETVNLDEIIFLYGSQRRFHSLNNQFWDNLILQSLVSIPKTPKSTKINPIMEKKKQEAMLIKKMIKFREENSTVCNGVQNLDFYEINTSYPIILKSFEIFPNFEYLKFGFGCCVVEFGFYGNLDWDLKSNKVTISSLEKSKKKCKIIECINVKVPCFIHKDFEHVFPNLERYCADQDCDEFGSFLKLKHLEIYSLCFPLPQSLEYLKLNMGISAKQIDQFMVGMPNLKTLIVEDYSRVDCLEKLIQFTNLEHLEVSIFIHSNQDFELQKHEDFLLKHLPKLNYVIVKGYDLPSHCNGKHGWTR